MSSACTMFELLLDDTQLQSSEGCAFNSSCSAQRVALSAEHQRRPWPGTVSESFLSFQLEACSSAAEWGQVPHAGRPGSASPLSAAQAWTADKGSMRPLCKNLVCCCRGCWRFMQPAQPFCLQERASPGSSSWLTPLCCANPADPYHLQPALGTLFLRAQPGNATLH